jgi:2-keto-4-pentenoate hydratase/2-oxohepta-3-ene-1,7-dioic acid hydratase in catechol pathway
MITRNPPKEIRDRLRREENFRCPCCSSPFLTFHHFDPPWESEHVHNEAAIIAVCPRWHGFCDGQNYSIRQAKELTSNPPKSPPSGCLPWNPTKASVIFWRQLFRYKQALPIRFQSRREKSVCVLPHGKRIPCHKRRGIHAKQ